MQTARTLGISVKRFDGWEPETVTFYEYEDGHLVRSVSRCEEEWDEEQQSWMLALAVLEADTCGGCGHRLSETTAAEADDQYIPETPSRCHACTAMDIGMERHRESAHARALRFGVRRRDG